MAAMIAQLDRLGVPFERVAAMDAHALSETQAGAKFAANGPLGPVPKGDQCCTLSHMEAWRQFLASGDSHGLILEDDVLLDGDAGPLLRDAAWVPPGAGLLKIERYGPPSQRVLLTQIGDIGDGRQVGRMLSRHTGAAAYIVTRDVARRLLDWDRPWTLPVDHMLFNPNNSPLARDLRPWQLVPAVARQSEAIGGRTDIDEWRKRFRGFGLRTLRRSLVRAYYDTRLLPQQLAHAALGRARLVQVDPPR
jgi:glycosyl transferase family 25